MKTAQGIEQAIISSTIGDGGKTSHNITHMIRMIRYLVISSSVPTLRRFHPPLVVAPYLRLDSIQC